MFDNIGTKDSKCYEERVSPKNEISNSTFQSKQRKIHEDENRLFQQPLHSKTLFASSIMS